MPPLVAMLRSHVPAAACAAACVLWSVSRRDEGAREAMRSGAIPPLIALLGSRSLDVSHAAAGALHALAGAAPAIASAVAAAGGIGALAATLEDPRNDEAGYEAAATLACIAMSEPDVVTASAAGCIRALIRALSVHARGVQVRSCDARLEYNCNVIFCIVS